VIHTGRVLVRADDDAIQVDGRRRRALTGLVAGARSVEGDEKTVDATLETVVHAGRIGVKSHDLSLGVDACGVGGRRTGNAESGEDAVGIAQVADTQIVNAVISRDDTGPVDVGDVGARRTRNIDGNDDAIDGAQEAVVRVAGIDVIARYDAVASNVPREGALRENIASAGRVEENELGCLGPTDRGQEQRQSCSFRWCAQFLRLYQLCRDRLLPGTR